MIAIGSDHGGYRLKEEIKAHLTKRGLEFEDFADGKFERGILICGTGIGISISANKVPGIRAALCTDCFTAEATRLHNDANILALGGRVVGVGLALKIVDTFLDTPFSNEERHIRRIGKIEDV